MVNGAGRGVRRAARAARARPAWRSAGEAELMHAIERILAPLGRRVDEASPLCDARLADGSRVNVVIPPLSLSGPCLTIRRFRRAGLLAARPGGAAARCRATVAELLAACVAARASVLVSGGTGSGKTTTLNALSGAIPGEERIVTIEDAAELRLRQRHVVRLEARPPNLEGRGEVTIRQLVRNALRMRPDRIVVGEVRGAGGARHAAGAEHRARRLAHHRARQLAGGRAAAGGDARADGRASGCRTRRCASRWRARSTWWCTRRGCRTGARVVESVTRGGAGGGRRGHARAVRRAAARCGARRRARWPSGSAVRGGGARVGRPA